MTSENTTYGSLPDARPVHLGQPALEGVVFEIRFVSDRGELDAGAAQRALTMLGSDISRVEEAVQHEYALEVGPDGMTSKTAPVARGWRFHSAEGDVVFTYLPNLASVQLTGKYERWSATMLPRIQALLAFVSEEVKPAIINRVGLRYVNRFPGDVATWSRMLSPAALGPLALQSFGNKVLRAQHEFGVRIGDEVSVVVRHGIVPGEQAGAGGYLLDLDGAHEGAFGYSDAVVLDTAERLNRTINSVFQMMLSPEGFAALQPHDLPEYQTGSEERP